MDLISAKESMVVLMKDPEKCLLLNAPTIAVKSLMSTQIAGLYNLIYSHIEDDFPRRDETYFHVLESITNNFVSHCAQTHDGQYFLPAPLTVAPEELINMKRVLPNTRGEDVYNTKVPGPTGAKLEMPPNDAEVMADTVGYGV